MVGREGFGVGGLWVAFRWGFSRSQMRLYILAQHTRESHLVHVRNAHTRRDGEDGDWQRSTTISVRTVRIAFDGSLKSLRRRFNCSASLPRTVHGSLSISVELFGSKIAVRDTYYECVCVICV